MIFGSLKILLEAWRNYKADRKCLISSLPAGKFCPLKIILRCDHCCGYRSRRQVTCSYLAVTAPTLVSMAAHSRVTARQAESAHVSQHPSSSLPAVSSQHLYALLLFVSPLWESFQLTNPAKIPTAAGRFPLSE